jgi:ubiquinone/menaquinone biosynthesis C-methylase UbiE
MAGRGRGPTEALDEVRRDWTALGAADPFWAVLVRPGGWELDEFLATGRADVAATQAWLAELCLPKRWGRALDFGCGVGRLSQALAEYAEEVVGVDISAPMLEVARRIDRTAGRCRFVHNESSDLRRFPDDHVDLVYSVLVLQHLPRPVIDGYLAELLRVLRPDGTAVIQVPTSTLWTVRGAAWRVLPFPVLRWLQRRILRYPAPMRMTVVSDAELSRTVARLGGEVVARRADPTDSKDFQLTRYVIRHKSGT